MYFKEFYPPTGTIENFEALNHHIHAYLEDMMILKNNIETLLGKLKNDIKKIAANKEQVDEFYRAGIEKTHQVFEGVTKHRNPHNHGGKRFYDGDLLKAKNAHSIHLMFQNPTFAGMLNPEHSDEFMKKMQKEKTESFEAGKVRWIEMARKNSEQASGYLNAILDVVHDNLYKFLKIKPTKDIFGTEKIRP